MTNQLPFTGCKGQLFLRFRLPLLVVLVLCLGAGRAFAQPAGFVDEAVAGFSGSGIVVGITFDESGRLFAWQHDGAVWVINNGVKASVPLIDISSECEDEGDLGLIGFALDPNFLTNGYIYLSYAVKPEAIPLSSYDSSPYARILRVSRYTVSNPAATFPTANLATGVSLFGETPAMGAPILSFYHMGGGICFGGDGSLLISIGDGGMYDNQDFGSHPATAFQSALDNGIMTEDQDIGMFRSPYDYSFSGKLLRLDPATGDGLPGNPGYDAADRRSFQSRIWAKGLRNPWKLVHVPGTGKYPHDPGKILIGDVGQSDFDELNLVDQPGLDFGWPFYEGMNHRYYRPEKVYPTEWEKPILAYRNGGEIRNGSVITPLGSLPDNDASMSGTSIVIGAFYNHDDFPEEYQRALYIADYTGNWINYIQFDEGHHPVGVKRFFTNSHSIFSIAVSPYGNGIYYSDRTSVRRIRYAPGNRPPVARISADSLFSHDKVLTTGLNGQNSYDPDGDLLTYNWDFGDGTSESGLAPHHKFSTLSDAPVKFKVILTVTDTYGLSAADSLWISLNNAPPLIGNAELAFSQASPSDVFQINLNGSATDGQTDAALLKYTWEIYLGHNGHEHLDKRQESQSVSLNMDALYCGDEGSESYYYKFRFIATDPEGNSSFADRFIYPNCGKNSQTLSFDLIADKLTTDAHITLQASATSGLPVRYYIVRGEATVLGNTLTLIGKPGTVTVRASQHGDASYNQARYIDQTFTVKRPFSAQELSFATIGDKTVSTPPFGLEASAGTGRAVRYIVMGGPAVVNGGVITLTGQEGYVQLRAYEAGDDATAGVFADQTFLVRDPCPAHRTLSGTLTVTPAHPYAAAIDLITTNTVESGVEVYYKAGESIQLNEDFFAREGSFADMAIEGCENE
ncbi:PQQ-dependent sugar dehydrogenase [Telluribacter sp.]|jgi:glucose/arabinose dehydrogenase|uniref:PQQ-dependent sugar dehydrogenase n=1 Tax=Telluribacter sp. TaxID=1978767 RepID=UPI002E103069|nr:PQQ-dependent sugar dehydrogenase [Telluribacter sp.]